MRPLKRNDVKNLFQKNKKYIETEESLYLVNNYYYCYTSGCNLFISALTTHLYVEHIPRCQWMDQTVGHFFIFPSERTWILRLMRLWVFPDRSPPHPPTKLSSVSQGWCPLKGLAEAASYKKFWIRPCVGIMSTIIAGMNQA